MKKYGGVEESPLYRARPGFGTYPSPDSKSTRDWDMRLITYFHLMLS
jgi:hypothetical protein